MDNKIKLRTKIEVSKIIRMGLENSYQILGEWTVYKKKLVNNGKNSSIIEYKIEILEKAIENVEDNIYNSEYGDAIDTFSKHGGCNNESAGH